MILALQLKVKNGEEQEPTPKISVGSAVYRCWLKFNLRVDDGFVQ